MTGYCCVLNFCRKVSPLEGSKNRDSLLKKLVCVCVEGGQGVGGCASMCVYLGGWVCTVSLRNWCACVCGGGGGGGHAFVYVKVGECVCA